MRGIKIDLVGKKFNKLKVIKDAGRMYRSSVKWECICECGKLVYATSNYLTSGHIKSCKECSHPYKDYSDLKIGKLTILKRIEDKINCYVTVLP